MPKQLPNYKEIDIESLRPFSLIQLIALDLDGTLLDSSESTLPETVLSLSSSLKNHRYGIVRTTIATGRTLTGARSLLDKLKVHKATPIILYNGSLVLNKKYDILYQDQIPPIALRQIIELSSRFKVKVIAYTCDLYGSGGPTENAIGWSSLDRPELDHNKMPVTWLDWGQIDDSISPSFIVIHTAGQSEVMSCISSELSKITDISYTHGSNAYIEIMPRQSNKGKALEFVANSLHLDRTKVLAMGDNDNDVEMLKWAGIGVAVDSASEFAKQSSDYIANQGVIDGAIEVLKIVRSAKRLYHPITGHPGKAKMRASSIINTKQNDLHLIGENESMGDHSIFVAEENVPAYFYEVLDIAVDTAILKYILDCGLLSSFKYGDKRMILKSDLGAFTDALVIRTDTYAPKLQREQLIEQDIINIQPNTRIDFMHEDLPAIPTLFSATRNLISSHRHLLKQVSKTEVSMPYFPNARLTSYSVNVIKYARKQLDQEKRVDISAVSQFARSAHYMGSKRALCGFLTEAISSVLPARGIVVDLMCGSGVASGAFNRIWKTYSSDAQEFCRILAAIHGGGFNRKAADNLISKISPIFKRHFDDLNQNLSDALRREEKIFYSNAGEALVNEYKHFMKSFPTAINLEKTDQWSPESEVMKRRNDPSRYPYCLFTSSFANIYFGVRQSAEIDSLRYSIDQLKDDDEKCWALGALIAAVSALGTTYGGHFAQPPIRGYKDVNINNISKIIDKRSPSIIHEFTVRLLNLSEQSENTRRVIESVPGPWNNALTILEGKLGGKQPVLVYLDAPYTREEYSRYYHLLETLVTYTYPSCAGIGLTPKPNERFKSEFFTKVKSQVEGVLANIITNVLKRGWMCAWSYSDSGTANIYNVLNSVHQEIDCHLKSYSAPFIHKSQGRTKHKNVFEYLTILSPIK